jgi:hypothetical protein
VNFAELEDDWLFQGKKQKQKNNNENRFLVRRSDTISFDLDFDITISSGLEDSELSVWRLQFFISGS